MRSPVGLGEVGVREKLDELELELLRLGGAALARPIALRPSVCREELDGAGLQGVVGGVAEEGEGGYLGCYGRERRP